MIRGLEVPHFALQEDLVGAQSFALRARFHNNLGLGGLGVPQFALQEDLLV